MAGEVAREPAGDALHGAFARFGAHQNLAVHVWANPALRNLDSAEANWAASPFHRDWLEKEPARRQYVEEFVAWSEAYMKRLLASSAGQSEVPAFR